MILLKVKQAVCFVSSGILLLLPFFSNAQNPQLITTVDTPDINIGQPLQYKVEATFPANTYKVTWLDIPDSIAHFEVIERQKSDTVESNGMVKIQQIVRLTSFDSGSRTIPPFVISFEPFINDTTLSLFTDSVQINVSFSQMDSTKTFHDIKSIISVKDEWPLWMWIAAAVSLIVMVLLVYYFFKKFRRKKPQHLFTSKLSPLEEAIQSLNELQKQQLLVKKEVKPYHSRLGEIFKRYVSRKTNADLLSLTSGEVLLKLNELLVNKEIISKVAGNLRMSDAVKFAKYIPADTASEEVFSNTRNVIEQIDQSILKNKSDS